LFSVLSQLVVDSISPSRVLVELNLSSNKFGDEGAIAVARQLSNLTNLYILDLMHNSGIGTEGAVALATAFPECPNLQRFYLYSSPIG
jgi:Ran GTPase-activating protein (RanGAP) involved in mRNA processing and transport